MGRPKKDDPKPHNVSQSDYVARQKALLGLGAYNDGEATRKRESRKRVWDSLEEEERERRRVLQRICAKRFREKKTIKPGESGPSVDATAPPPHPPHPPPPPQQPHAVDLTDTTTDEETPKRKGNARALKVKLFTSCQRRMSRSSSSASSRLTETTDSDEDDPATGLARRLAIASIGTRASFKRMQSDLVVPGMSSSDRSNHSSSRLSDTTNISPIGMHSCTTGVENWSVTPSATSASDHDHSPPAKRKKTNLLDGLNDPGLRVRSPGKARLYYRIRKERELYKNEAEKLRDEIAKLRKMREKKRSTKDDRVLNTCDGGAGDVAVDDGATDDSDSDGRDGSDDGGADSGSAGVKAKQIKAYNAFTEKLRKLPTNERVVLLRRVTSPSKLKARRVTSQLARDVGLNRRTVISMNDGPVLRRAASENRRERVLEFLQHPEHSVTLAGKKDTVTVNGEKKQKVVLTQFLKIIHKVYNTENEDKLVSLSFLSKVRREAKFIKPLNYHSTSVCLCIQHQNYALKLRAIQASGLPTIPDNLVAEYTKTTLKERLKEADLPLRITYQTWKRVLVEYGDPKDPKTTKKLRPVDVTTTKNEFVSDLIQEFPAISTHVQRAVAQHRSIRELRQEMGGNECTIQMDFAENWAVSYDEEVQSAYYAKDALTVHPAVIHLRINGTTFTRCLCLISDDRHHDAGAILAIIRVLTTFVKEEYPVVRTIHYASDSPSSQYRNISIFSVISKHEDMFGLSCTWSYFEAGHGKGPCDGVGAAAKRKADSAVKRGILIQDSMDFVRECNIEGSVTYICLPVVDTYRARDELNMLVSKSTVPGTMKVHAVVVITPSKKIAIRETSCYKPCCWSNHQAIMGCTGWKVHTLFEDTGPTAENTEQRTSLQQPSEQPTEPSPELATENIEQPTLPIQPSQQPTDPPAEPDAENNEQPTPPLQPSEQPTEPSAELATENTEQPTLHLQPSQQPTDLPAEPDAENNEQPTPLPQPLEQPTEPSPELATENTEQPTPPIQYSQQPTDPPGEPIAENNEQPTPPPQRSEQPTEPSPELATENTEQPTLLLQPSQQPTDPSGEPNAENIEQTTPAHKHQLQDYVACIYEDHWYIGKIIEVLPDDEYKITFMSPTNTVPVKYRWPEREDILEVSCEDILMCIPAPVPSGTGRRKIYHEIMTETAAAIAEQFANF